MKVLVGMSGGVDSSVAALLLLQQGYDVTGVTMKLFSNSSNETTNDKKCCSIDDVSDARRIAYKLSIDHIVMNFTYEFENFVIKKFVNDYQSGITPNPCVLCNQKIKFEALLKKAIALDFDYISTGHYANVEYSKSLKRWLIKKSKSSKDQSYVLYGMKQYQLKRTLMPLGNMEKTKIRNIAKKHNLPVAEKAESQEICFINKSYSSFIEEYSQKPSLFGNFINENGKILGKHRGIINYTIGQRKGLGISFGKPMFVLKIDSKKNQITLGPKKSQYKKKFTANNLNFILFEKLTEPISALVKIRYKAELCKAEIIPIDFRKVEILLEESEKAITPGQSVVFYTNDSNYTIIGGGIIEKIF
ncbi:MAG: tRNA 2-thiouridine(34) synthase MnmA [Oscillospiraceae bacterium]|jgi:tRNA-specific 2-thiouridylase|nr:tRNA 2-thiouridine(34) synthase MnmA [Oscillospiraceae bacterium]